MYLVLVLIIPMVTWAHPEVRQLPTAGHKGEPLLPCHSSILVSIQQTHHLVDYAFLAIIINAISALMFESVCRIYLVKVPVSAAIEIV